MERGPESSSRLDERLVRLGGREAACRRTLGSIAARFLSGRGHQRLGFARLGDYARECLGVSARELQSLARVATALASLPHVARAFAAGEISWTTTRLLAQVARRESEEHWLALARGVSVRALRATIARATDPAGDRKRRTRMADAGDADDEDDLTLDGEEAVRFRLTCPRGVRRRWHQTVELARCVAGEQAPVWQAAEVIAAEALSGYPVGAAAAATAGAPAGAAAAAALGDDCATYAPVDAAATAALVTRGDAEAHASRTRGDAGANAGRDAPPGDAAAFADADAVPTPTPPEAVAVQARSLVGAVAVAESDLTGGPSMDDVGRSDPAVLDRSMRATLAELRRLDAEIGMALRDVAAGHVHRRLGFSSLAAYARDRVGISAGKARTLLALERRMARVPALRDTYARGALSWSRAIVMLPAATGDNAAAWVGRANEVTVRRLEAEVAWALDRYDARPDEGVPGPPSADTDVRMPGPPAADAGERPSGSVREVPDEVPKAETDRAPVERQMGARSRDLGGDAPCALGRDAPIFLADVEITFRAPRSVAAVLHEALMGFARPREPRWRAMARLLDHVAREWQRQPRHRDPIFARDGWRCAVPACAARRNLHDHHVRYRSRGGGNERDNRVSVCAWHHLRGIHAGRVRASGRAPDALTWELGLDEAGRAWRRFAGDRYLTAATRVTPPRPARS